MKQSDVMSLPDGMHRIEPGLYLRVRERGKFRNWVLKIQVKGKAIQKMIGSARKLTILQAKEQAKILRGKALSGQSLSEKVEQEDSHLFKDIYAQAIETRQKVGQWKNDKTLHQWHMTIETYALPKLGKKDVADITRDDILSVLVPLWQTKTQTAKKLRQRLEVVFDFCLRRGWRTAENPARWRAGLEFDLPSPQRVREVVHHEAPTLEELQNAVPRLMNSISGKMILFGILTACRCKEFVLAEWDEIDLREKIFSVPPERRKDKRAYPHRVPLSSQAIALLDTIPRDSEAVFAGKRSKFMSLETPRLMLIKIIGRKVTMHGCRSTFSDWCAETGKDETLREKALMHTTGTEVVQAYQRSDLLERRRKLMQEWADVVCKKIGK